MEQAELWRRDVRDLISLTAARGLSSFAFFVGFGLEFLFFFFFGFWVCGLYCFAKGFLVGPDLGAFGLDEKRLEGFFKIC